VVVAELGAGFVPLFSQPAIAAMRNVAARKERLCTYIERTFR
jgi:hypothetical protein